MRYNTLKYVTFSIFKFRAHVFKNISSKINAEIEFGRLELYQVRSV